MSNKILSLLLIRENGKVLLGMKKRGFGAGKYNGFGGKLEKGEDIQQCAMRELKEEAHINALDLSRRGVLIFDFENVEQNLEVHVISGMVYIHVIT